MVPPNASNTPAKPVSKLAALAASRKEAAETKPLSKLQQRMQTGVPVKKVPIAPVVDEAMEETIPKSSLFDNTQQLEAAPSAFADTLITTAQVKALKPQVESLLGSAEFSSAFDKPSPDDIVNSARKNATYNKRK